MIDSISLFGTSISLYYLFWFLGAVSVLILGCILGKNYGFTSARSTLYVSGAIVLGYLLLWGTSWVFGGGRTNGLNYVRIVIFMPIPVWILTSLFRDPFWKLADLVSPLLAIYHGVTHIGCIFAGCCHGYPSEWGLFSNEVGAVCFPIQPIEAISSIAIGIVLLCMAKKPSMQGRLYAWYLLLFGSTRFIWEFFRDNEKIWLGISGLAFHALTAAAIGLAALLLAGFVHKRSPAL